MVGLGDIARKAYLPVLATDPTVEPILVTRDDARRAEIAAAWRTGPGFATVPDLLAAGPPPDVAFVHAATAAHPEIVAALLAARVPVCVDKPLASSAHESVRLVDLARSTGTGLAVAFNRRYAPAVTELAGWPALDVAVLEKHRAQLPGDPRWVVFDDFVHVLDTLRFLVCPAPEAVDVDARWTADGRLGRVSVVLRQAGRVGLGVMDRESGLDTERLTVCAPGRRRTVDDLTDVVDFADGRATAAARATWRPVPEARGFRALVADVLAAVRAGRALDPTDALATHLLAEQVVAAVEGTRPAASAT
jgi:virulence factor